VNYPLKYIQRFLILFLNNVIMLALIIGIVIALIVLGVGVYFMMSSGSSSASQSTVAPPLMAATGGTSADSGTPLQAAPAGRTYTFYQGKDSNGNDIKRAAALADNVPGLKQACDALPNCAGFNTNAWLKHTILPKQQWYTWTQDPAKGLYVAEKFSDIENLVNWG
jgi:hypothetical protein